MTHPAQQKGTQPSSGAKQVTRTFPREQADPGAESVRCKAQTDNRPGKRVTAAEYPVAKSPRKFAVIK